MENSKGKKKWRKKKLEISQKEPHKRIYATCMKEYGRRKRRMRARWRWLDLGHKLTLTYAESHTERLPIEEVGLLQIFYLFTDTHTHTLGGKWPSVE